MSTLTPETDAELVALDGWKPNDKGKEEYHKRCRLVRFARKLERERDEARRDLTTSQIDYDKCATSLEDVTMERDQLRKVCDSWKDTSEMLMAVVCNSSGGDWTKETKGWQEAARKYVDEYYTRLKEYNQLPHVKNQKK